MLRKLQTMTLSIAIIFGFCAISVVVSAIVAKMIKTYILYVVASATLASMLPQLVGYVYYGRIDEWGYIAFPVTWLVAAACATFYYLALRRK